jgi:hypothetical protein
MSAQRWVAGIPKIRLISLKMWPSGVAGIVNRHPDNVNRHAIRSSAAFSWRNDLPDKPKNAEASAPDRKSSDPPYTPYKLLGKVTTFIIGYYFLAPVM